MSSKQNISPKLEKQLITTILFLFVAAGLIYTIVTPVFEVSDEWWHYPMVRHLADGNPLPVQTYDPNLAGPWKQEASQPPLYYYAAAALTFWIDTADMEQVRHVNPHVAPGEIATDGNINLVVHDPALSPSQGTLLAVRVVRLFSVLLGACTVYLTYLIGREAVPDRPDIALMAAGLNAFTPMFLFISGSVNNDNLAIPLASLGLLLLIRLVRHAQKRPPHLLDKTLLGKILLIGAVAGLAVLTKQGTIGLLPLTWGTLFIVGWLSTNPEQPPHEQTLPDFMRQTGIALYRSLVWFAIFFIPILLIAGWWYWRNIQLYGDLLGWSAFEAVLGVRETPASVAQLWDEHWGFMLSYWGQFGGLNVMMPEWIYRLMTAILIAAIPGGVWFVFRQFRTSEWWAHTFQPSGRRPTLQQVLSGLIHLIIDRFGLTVCILFSFAIVYGLVQWATKTWSSQGRLVFTAISALNVLFAAGLATLLDYRFLKKVKPAVVLFFALVSFGVPFLTIAPAYRPSTYAFELENGQMTADGPIFGGDLQLAAAHITTDQATFAPGDTVSLETAWQVLGQPQTDWSIFVHLNDPVLGVPVAQRDMYMGQGLVATSFMRPGESYQNRFDIKLPDTLVAPAELDVVIGLYKYGTNQRAILPDGSDHLIIGSAKVSPRAGETPNPVSVNFENKFELVGFELNPRRVTAGETINATFYWKLTAPVTIDYKFTAQIVGAENTRWAAVDLERPTTSWEAGKIVPVEMVLDVNPEAAAGTYPLRLSIYTQTETGFQNLQRVTADERLTDAFINLTQIRID